MVLHLGKAEEREAIVRGPEDELVMPDPAEVLGEVTG